MPKGETWGYAKLCNSSFTYYIQKLHIVLGRKSSSYTEVDIHLEEKVVSRKHAQIKYNVETKCFELIVLGRNGAEVNGKSYKQGSSVPLSNKDVICIGETKFYFLLPRKAAAKKEKHKKKPKDSKEKKHVDTKSEPKMDSMDVDEPLESEVEAGVEEAKPEVEDEGDKKPGVPYATLCALALKSSPDNMMTSKEVFRWILENYPYYQTSTTGWKSSVRQTLNTKKYFERIQDPESTTPKFKLNSDSEDMVLMGVVGRKVTKALKEKGVALTESSGMKRKRELEDQEGKEEDEEDEAEDEDGKDQITGAPAEEEEEEEEEEEDGKGKAASLSYPNSHELYHDMEEGRDGPTDAEEPPLKKQKISEEAEGNAVEDKKEKDELSQDKE